MNLYEYSFWCRKEGFIVREVVRAIVIADSESEAIELLEKVHIELPKGEWVLDDFMGEVKKGVFNWLPVGQY